MAQPGGASGSTRPALTYDDNEADDASAEDVLDQILENYNFICHPEIRLKLKHELQQVALGLAVAKPWHHRPRVRLTLKPLVDVSPLAKVVQKVLLVPTHAQACVFSRKLSMGWLRLQFMAGYNWARKRPTLDYRITTKWSEGGRVKRKEQYSVGDGLLLRAKWNMDLQLPDMEGHLGADDLELDPMDVDFGKLDFEISQVDVVLSPHLWLRNAQRRAAAQEAESGSEATVTAAGRSSMTQHGAVAGPASSSRTCCSSSGSSAAGGACSKGAEHGTGLALSGAACSRSQHAGAADRGMRGQMSDGTAGSTQAGEGIRRGLGAWLQGLVPDGNKGL